MLPGILIGDKRVKKNITIADWSACKPLSATLAIAEPYTACKEGCAVIENQAEISGKVAVIGCGDSIPLAQKAQAAQTAGAVGVIFVNDDETKADDTAPMDGDGTTVDITVAMVSYNEGTRIKALGANASVVFTGRSLR